MIKEIFYFNYIQISTFQKNQTTQNIYDIWHCFQWFLRMVLSRFTMHCVMLMKIRQNERSIRSNLINQMPGQKEIIALCVVLSVSLGLCPSSCNCEKNTYDCIECLQGFLRIYNTATNQCQCLNGYVEKTPVENYCCPRHCASCYQMGCTSCLKNFQVQYDAELSIYSCVCRKNFVFNNNTCICRSYFQPTFYYEVPLKNKCIPCPVNCTCSNKGCESCSAQTMRTIDEDISGNKECRCRSPFTEIDGVCKCLPNCTCDLISGNITCQESSFRILNQSGGWICKTPFIDVNGNCKCQGFFTYKSITQENPDCYCQSYFAPSKFYQYGGQCYQCVEGCICNEKGCIYCQPNLNREVISFSCPCKSPYLQFQNQCVCVQPYYLHTDQNGTISCKCLSFFNNTAYVWNPYTLDCFACPAQCKCDIKGCNSCQQNSLRNIVQVWTISHCPCKKAAEEVLGVCQCNSYSTLYVRDIKTNTTDCACKKLPQVYSYIDACDKCPEGCQCNGSGCYQCDNTSNRIIVQSRSLLANSYCPCRVGYIEVTMKCLCKPPSLWNSVTLACECKEPYIKIGINCVCKSVNEPTKYYLDSASNTCHPCPIGCECNATGCFNCFPYTLRTNFWKNNLMQCPCFQTALLVNQICTICPRQTYHLFGECISCPTCETCNILGCLTCFIGSTIDSTKKNNVTCNCVNSSLINIRGNCSCRAGQYKDKDGYCQICPNNCQDCTYDNGNFTCISCQLQVHRYNSPSTGCPCQQGYSELGRIQKYCCPKQCINCDQNGCTQCPLFSFRVLANNSCLCMNNLISNGSINCTCPVGFYLLIDQCIQCPEYCDSCFYNETEDRVRCHSCQKDMNRQLVPALNCPCSPFYMEANPILEFCYPKYCTTVSAKCKQCSNDRIPNPQGTRCGCKSGWYENIYSQCKPCNMEGCLECSSANFCTLCDFQNGYYLTNTSCKYNLQKSEYLISQNTNQIIIQIKGNFEMRDYSSIMEIKAYLQHVQERISSSQILSEAYNLTINNILTTKSNVLVLKIQNPNISFTENMLTVAYTFTKRAVGRAAPQSWQGFDEAGRFLGMSEKIHIYMDYVYSKYILETSSHWSYVFSLIICLSLLIFEFILYIRGMKHIQIIFFLQTLSLLGLTLKDAQMEIAPFLFNLRFSYYSFGNSLQFMIPSDYLEHSFGNFIYFTGDSNIIRLAGTTICIALGVCIGSIGARMVFIIYQKSNQKKFKRYGIWIKRHKKTIYRSLEFLFKTCMYPILFFVMVTFKNWSSRTMKGDHYQQFQSFSQFFSIFLILLYAIMTVISVRFETIAKIYRYENASEYIIDLLNSLIIVFSASTHLFMFLFVNQVIRGAAYLFVRRKYLRDFQRLQYIKIISVILELFTLGLVLSRNLVILIVFTLLTVISHIIHGSSVVYFTNKMAHIAKRANLQSEKIAARKMIVKLESPDQYNRDPDSTTAEFQEKRASNSKLSISSVNFDMANESPDPVINLMTEHLNSTTEQCCLPKLSPCN